MAAAGVIPRRRLKRQFELNRKPDGAQLIEAADGACGSKP
jgi:hypothetical protein